MDAPSSNPPSPPVGHTRNVSFDERRRASMPRPSPRDPLDTVDPLAVAVALSDSETGGTHGSRSSSSNPTRTSAENADDVLERPVKDLSFLLRPEIYHPITSLDTPPAFRAPSLQPDSSAPLGTLLRTGQFHAAAILAAHLLTTLSPSSTPASRIFTLVYARLATLTRINQTSLAAQESKALEDLSSEFYRDPITNQHIVPWELRVLAVRLQAIGWSDWRRGIEGYYELGRECRMEIVQAGNDARKSKLWRQRLEELGDRVTDGLIEMGDLQAAARFVESQRGEADDEAVNNRLALLYLRIGNVDAAGRCISHAVS